MSRAGNIKSLRKQSVRNLEAMLLSRCQYWWKAEVTYTAATDEQFSDECFLYVTYSRWAWLAAVKGWLGARRKRRQVERRCAAGRADRGWL